MDLLFALVIVGLVIWLSYWGTKWLSKRFNTISAGKHIKIMDRTMLSQDKFLVLTKVNGKVYFLGVTSQSIETISTMDESEFPKEEPVVEQDFASILKENIRKQMPFLDKFKKKDK
ncbi:MAG: hypothetical protein BGN88_08810 [Clostridiales bacterium 43-6]|nr:MAG: hypothetical protein BGN88_08810 [Clostridiales bacterium 43-6]